MITCKKSSTVILYKLKESVFHIIHLLLEYIGSASKDHFLHCQPMTDFCESKFLVGADLLPSIEIKIDHFN